MQAWTAKHTAEQRGRNQQNSTKRARQDSEITPAIQAIFSGWGATSTLTKLHELAVYIRVSTNHHDEWFQIVGRDLGIDNATRWNSWYDIIDVAINKKAKIMLFMSEYHSELPSTLTDQDWDILRETHTFLQPFWEATLGGQREDSGLAFSLSTMDELLLWFEEQKVCSTLSSLHQSNISRSNMPIIHA